MKAIIFTSALGILAMISEIIGLKKIILPLLIVGLLLTIGVNIYTEWNYTQVYYGMMLADNYYVAFSTVLLSITVLWLLLSSESYLNEEYNRGDHYALILFSTVGGLLLVSFNNLATLFMGVEILSIPLYILAGSDKNNKYSIEASIKYFLLGSFATGIMLLGIALLYGATGTFDLGLIAQYNAKNMDNTLYYGGTLLLTLSFAFKVSAVPFHFWAPDVYTGAPTFITAFMSAFVKVAAFAGFYHFIQQAYLSIPLPMENTIILLSGATILVGNIAAVYQTDMKRILAFSGIAQAGYLLLLLPIQGELGKSSLLVYLIAYGIANLPAFYVLYKVSRIGGSTNLESFEGLGKKQPILALVLTLSMISLAGLPPAAGFFGKFYLFTLSINNGYLWSVLIAVIGSLISIYYYFKVIIRMYTSTESTTGDSSLSPSLQVYVTLVVLLVSILILGLFPDILVSIGRLL
ncbi:MAG: NADH-quinone oxidoreductase subunit N [Cytophagaceae bacterium]|jgi:NADH-quinone oxidoreductase subunit N|nr:NADH-quinone oxidoreductase subunit N [Cytophagaceae bacterium]